MVSSSCPVSASLTDTVYSQAQPKESSEEDHTQQLMTKKPLFAQILCPNIPQVNFCCCSKCCILGAPLAIPVPPANYTSVVAVIYQTIS